MHAEARTSPGPQHLRALQRANAVRLARADLKRRVADGEVSAAEVILRSPWEAESMTVSDLLTSQKRWGSTRCRKLLQCAADPREQDDRIDDRAPAPGSRPDAARRRGVLSHRRDRGALGGAAARSGRRRLSAARGGLIGAAARRADQPAGVAISRM